MPVMLDNRAYFSVSLSVGRRFTALVVEGWGSAMALLLLWVERLHFPARGPWKVQAFEDSEQIKDAGERVDPVLGTHRRSALALGSLPGQEPQPRRPRVPQVDHRSPGDAVVQRPA